MECHGIRLLACTQRHDHCTSAAVDPATQLQHDFAMSKTAILPQVRVEVDFRAQAEAVLRPGESPSEPVEASVRRVVEHQQAQSEFDARGQAAWEHYQATGVSHSTDEVLARMRAMTAARRAELECKSVERQT